MNKIKQVNNWNTGFKIDGSDEWFNISKYYKQKPILKAGMFISFRQNDKQWVDNIVIEGIGDSESKKEYNGQRFGMCFKCVYDKIIGKLSDNYKKQLKKDVIELYNLAEEIENEIKG